MLGRRKREEKIINIQAPILIIKEGAGLSGYCDVSSVDGNGSKKHSRRKK